MGVQELASDNKHAGLDESSALPPSSVVIASRNRQQMLYETVASILDGVEVPDEIVVVDQSDERHPQLERMVSDRPCTIRYMFSDSVGVSRGRNLGIAAARNDILVFTDDDMVMTKDWHGNIVRALLREGRRSVVTGQVLPTEVERAGGFVPSTKVDERPTHYMGRIGQEVLYPNSMALFRSAIDDVGMFDERFGGGARFSAAEDNELAFRLLEAGYCIVYEPTVVLYHRAWRASQDYIPLCWNYGRGQGGYYGKYLSFRDRYMLRRMVIDIKVLIKRVARNAWREPRNASGDIAYLCGLLSGALQWLLTEKRG